LVARGAVLVGGSVADKPARLVGASESVFVRGAPARRFVSRGGEKLDAALSYFAVDVGGRRCLDAGASTGGFTDCLLRRGAATVVAVDVGHGQLDSSLRHDPRVQVFERTDIRTFADRDAARQRFEVVVADLSFISLTTVADVLAGELPAPAADILVLVKPQFESGRAEASRGRGVIRSRELRRAALDRVASALASHGASIMGAMASPILGPAGNAEFFVYARAPGAPGRAGLDAAALAQALDAAVDGAPDRRTPHVPDPR
jgi:23S rRNA (cytidine1920-2'-O)/16S rRNA (cytidine1409-2'-O)-methyltransferase